MLVLFETAEGFALFRVLDEGRLTQVEDIRMAFSSKDSAKEVVELKAFTKFHNTSDALTEATSLIDGKLSDGLLEFLKKNCEGETLAVADTKLGEAIHEKLEIVCVNNEIVIMELMRGLRNYFAELLSGLGDPGLTPMTWGLSHSLSRYKLRFNPQQVDTMIIHAIGLLDELDKELNTYMRTLREWYGWHFPELGEVVTDNILYAKAVKLMGDRVNAGDLDFSKILDLNVVEELKREAVRSVGIELKEIDFKNIKELCDQVLSLSEYRSTLFDYLKSRMNTIAPNLTALVGELVGARLIAHSGSLLELAKKSASRIQIIGAEKALFRAQETNHATPKYGLIYHASMISQAAPNLKGKIARSLAAKTAIAVRYDAFGEGQDNSMGMEHRARMENHIRYLEEIELRRSGLLLKDESPEVQNPPNLFYLPSEDEEFEDPNKFYDPFAEAALEVTRPRQLVEEVDEHEPMNHTVEATMEAEVATERKRENKKRKAEEEDDRNSATGDAKEKEEKKSRKSTTAAYFK